MAATNENADRRVVPRWRPFRSALATGELAAGTIAKSLAIDGSSFLEEKALSWHSNKAVPFALDLISAATVLGVTDDAKEAANFLLESNENVSTVGLQLARRILNVLEPEPTISQGFTREHVIAGLRELKNLRLTQPQNAFVWIDLARLYVILGQINPARQALKIALSLAPTERFIVRSAARFYLHIKDHDQALNLLRSNPRTPFDSWLIAAEIAVSSVLERTPKFVGIGRSLLANGTMLPFHTSELSSALGSLEMFSGNNKQANRLFLVSLKVPTDNALAQGVWASRRTGLGVVQPELLKASHTSEAQTLDASNRGDWKKLMAHADAWALDETFSARPRLLASATATSLLGQPHLGETIATEGLRTNPGHPGLINNIAFSRIGQGRASAALEIIKSVNSDLMTDVDAICLIATIGLANFRIGNVEEGRNQYEAAIRSAERRGNLGLKTLATLYLARERVLNGEAEGLSQFRKAYDEAKRFSSSNIPAISDQLAKEIQDAQKSKADKQTSEGTQIL